ncbi:sirohydrochlorin chelatase [Paenibacillus alvei]|uniref:sirohydrochlorin chelatase n=1 Tax=Paenibacillus alvei TaxID=44250 RepID=UPI0018CCD1DA|nr:CbiX/SirB N-terminal domain-containing protein [Paenibacillus alvei]MBG9734962.1 hypothetical protein [Paenibacillus alvei]MBG9744837.1 hypothetical protein [Paenibacillus alvei]MCY9578714.1 hypothetical protein [Paenibacillus alvei]MCY9583772.1 hypothetical protein [Paenibacillus alvei]
MKPGLLIISHGSRDESWVTLVEEAIAQAQWPQGVAVASSYLECVPGRDIQYGIDTLEAQGVNHIGVIPLFVSAGSTHADEIAYALGVKPAPLCETDLEPFQVQACVFYGRPLDGGDVVPLAEASIDRINSGVACVDCAEPSREATASSTYRKMNEEQWSDDSGLFVRSEGQEELLLDMIEARLRGLGVLPHADAVLLVAHGSRYEPFTSRWHSSLRRLARRLVQRGACAGASHALLCCEDIADAVQRLSHVLTSSQNEMGWGGRAEQLAVPLDSVGGMDTLRIGADALEERIMERRVAVVPVFLSRGYFTSHVIPERFKDVPVLYDGEALLPHPALSKWLQQEAVRLLRLMEARTS